MVFFSLPTETGRRRILTMSTKHSWALRLANPRSWIVAHRGVAMKNVLQSRRVVAQSGGSGSPGRHTGTCHRGGEVCPGCEAQASPAFRVCRPEGKRHTRRPRNVAPVVGVRSSARGRRRPGPSPHDVPRRYSARTQDRARATESIRPKCPPGSGVQKR